MEENEYKDNEKVLFKTRGKLTLPGKKPEEADCFVTEGHVVIEAEEPITIPVSRIKGCFLWWSIELTLTFRDDLNKKQELSLETTDGNLPRFKEAIDNRRTVGMTSNLGFLNIYLAIWWRILLVVLFLGIVIVSIWRIVIGGWHWYLLFPIVSSGVVAFIFFSGAKDCVKDIRVGRTKVVGSVVRKWEEKNYVKDITYYYIGVKGLSLDVSPTIYDWLSEGEEVCVSYWPHTKIVSRVDRIRREDKRGAVD